MIHREDRHYLLAPHDIERHLADDHRVFPNIVAPEGISVDAFFGARGIPSNGDPILDWHMMCHEVLHELDATDLDATSFAEAEHAAALYLAENPDSVKSKNTPMYGASG